MFAFRLALLLLLGVALAPSEQAPAAGQEQPAVTVTRFDGGSRHQRLRHILTRPQSTNGLTYARELFLDQKLDHYDPTNLKTWKQRYFSRDDLHQEGGPVFIYIGGEGEEDASTLADGALLMTELARTFKAMLFDLEHRFYGRSAPTADMSSQNLKYLSADQALADLAYFIEAMKAEGEIEEGQKVVVFGGSYPGNLAAWARYKYPHLISAAVSSSAPVHSKADFVEYMEVVGRSLIKVGGQKCRDNVKKAFDRVQKLLLTDDGYVSIKTLFHVDNDLKDKLDLDNFISFLSNPFAEAVQYNRDNIQQYSIKYACKGFQGDLSADQAVDSLAKLVLGINYYNPWKQYDFSYNGTVESYRDTAFGSAGRPWLYQTCTEFGYFQTFSGNDTPFPAKFNAVDFDYQMCKDIFGDIYDEAVVTSAVERNNIVFGDRKPDVTNVLFVNGDVDPWHALGILSDLSDQAQAILIDGGSHCADMDAPSARDSEGITAAHQRVHEFIRSAIYEDPSGGPARS